MRVSEIIADQQKAANGNINKDIWGGLFYNVKVYGAKGDGSTDDTAAIQAAIDAAFAAGGGIVYFSPGTYLSGRLTIYSNITLEGSRKQLSQLKLKNGVNDHFLVNSDSLGGNSNIQILNLKIDGNKANQTGSGFGIYFDKVTDIFIEQVYVTNAKSHGIDVRNGSNAFISNCYAVSNGGNGINLNNMDYADVASCLSDGNSDNGIYLENTASYCTISDNISINNGKSGFSIPLDSPSTGVSISDNISAYNDFHGFEIQGSNIAVDGNISAYNGANGSHQGILVNGTRNTITGNEILYNFGVGIDLGNCNQCLVDGNMVEVNGGIGIEVNSSRDSVVSNNQVIANGRVDNTLAGIMVWGNNQFVGINSTNNIVTGNRVTNAGIASRQKYGIRVDPNTSNNMIKDNDVTDGGYTANIKLESASVKCRDNIGFNADNLSVSFAVDSIGWKTIILPHGLGITPDRKNIMAIVDSNGVTDFLYYALMVDNADATNVVIRVYVSTASATAGAQSKVNVHIR